MEEQLYQACSDGKVEEVQKLLQNEQININWQNQNYPYGTPFYIACNYGRIDIVKLLLNDIRVDISKATKYGYTPFYIACEKGHIEIVKYLLACRREIDINKKGNDGKTGLGIAREKGNEEKKEWESEEGFENKKRNYLNIIELIESFERNQNETRTKLRIELGLAGKFIDLFIIVIAISF